MLTESSRSWPICAPFGTHGEPGTPPSGTVHDRQAPECAGPRGRTLPRNDGHPDRRPRPHARPGRHALPLSSFICHASSVTVIFDILTNVIANVVFWLGLGVIAFLYSRLAQRKFLRFFGLREAGLVAVVLSNLWSPEGSRRKVGYTVSQHELLASQSIVTLFSSAPLRLPELVRGLVDGIWLRGKIAVETLVAEPRNGDQDHRRRLSIVVGATPRNSLRRDCVERHLPAALLAHEMTDAAGLGSDEVHEVIVQRSNGDIQHVKSSQGVAIIERIVLPESGDVFFFCCGSRADTTRGAVEYLTRHWRRLHRKFSEEPFVVCLGFPLPEIYPRDYIEPAVIAEFRP